MMCFKGFQVENFHVRKPQVSQNVEIHCCQFRTIVFMQSNVICRTGGGGRVGGSTGSPNKTKQKTIQNRSRL